MTRWTRLLLLAPFFASAGCFATGWPFAAEKPPGEVAFDSFILQADGKLVSEKSASALPPGLARDLEAARDAYRKEEYDRAERLFGAIADNEKNAPVAIQEAWYYRAECLRLAKRLPKACDSYAALLNKYPSTGYRDQCCQRMYDIACFWLEETWEEMKQDKERREGKRWIVVPRMFSMEGTKPFFDREGRAVEALERVRLHDLNGPLADQALYRCGVVKMYHENFREADHYFSQIHARHPDGKLAAKSIELAVFCKQMATGGSAYDGRKTAEAKKLIQVALASYPELANDPEKNKYLKDQAKAIDLQQAEKDFNQAEFYRRRGKPGSAYFMYELVRTTYPGTPFAQKAAERWASLRAELQASGKAIPAPVKPQDRRPTP
ncbi:MAG: tetratricopeptide repeat protein [Gemmataceae bacterium]|nr:tetratricopeptide repeat protein [Gemmataceae bacterium]